MLHRELHRPLQDKNFQVSSTSLGKNLLNKSDYVKVKEASNQIY